MDVIDRDTIVGPELVTILCVLQAGDGGHAPVVKNHDHTVDAMLDSIYENLRVHHERAVTGKCNAIPMRVSDGRCQQGGNGKTHVRRAGFGNRVACIVVFDNLKPVGLHVTGIKKFDSADGFGEVADNLDGCGLTEDRCLPDLIHHWGCSKALGLERGPFSLLGFARFEPCLLRGQVCVVVLIHGDKQSRDHCADITLKANGLVVVGQVGQVAVDVYDAFSGCIPDAGAISLTNGPRANDNNEIGLRHGIVAADRAFRSADMHVLRMCVRQDAG